MNILIFLGIILGLILLSVGLTVCALASDTTSNFIGAACCVFAGWFIGCAMGILLQEKGND